jgi:hypothetical protein
MPVEVALSPAVTPPDMAKVNDESVAERYRGTTADEHDMAILGKKQVLRVSMCSHLSGPKPAVKLTSGFSGISTY